MFFAKKGKCQVAHHLQSTKSWLNCLLRLNTFSSYSLTNNTQEKIYKMACVGCSNSSGAAAEDRNTSKIIDAELRASRKEQANSVKLLLLGRNLTCKNVQKLHCYDWKKQIQYFDKFSQGLEMLARPHWQSKWLFYTLLDSREVSPIGTRTLWEIIFLWL